MSNDKDTQQPAPQPTPPPPPPPPKSPAWDKPAPPLTACANSADFSDIHLRTFNVKPKKED